jgi:hypothetical protein
MATTTVTEYTVGTLVVDIFQAKSKDLIWRGVAQDVLSDEAERTSRSSRRRATSSSRTSLLAAPRTSRGGSPAQA